MTDLIDSSGWADPTEEEPISEQIITCPECHSPFATEANRNKHYARSHGKLDDYGEL